MKVKLDENVTAVAKKLFQAAGHQADNVSDEALTGIDDDVLPATCTRERRVLVTFDVGFGDVRAHPPGSHSGVVLLRLSDQQPAAVLDVLERLLQAHPMEEIAGALTIVTEGTVRVRREPHRR